MQTEREFVETKIKEWIEVVQRDPTDFGTLTAIGSAYGKLGQHDVAMEFFEKALRVNPLFAEAQLGLASAYGFSGRLEEKIEACRKAIALKPDYVEAYGNLGSALGKAGHYQESVEALQHAVRLKPDFADAHFALGLAYLSLGQNSHAARQVSVLRKLNSTLASQLADLGRRSD